MAISDDHVNAEEEVKGFTVTQLAERMIRLHRELGIAGNRAPTYRQWNHNRGKFPLATTIQNELSGGWAQVATAANLKVPHFRSTKSGIHLLDEPIPKLADIGRRMFELERGGTGLSFYRNTGPWKEIESHADE